MSAADPEDKTRVTDTSPQALMHILEAVYNRAANNNGNPDEVHAGSGYMEIDDAYDRIQAYISDVIGEDAIVYPTNNANIYEPEISNARRARNELRAEQRKRAEL